MAIPLVFQAKAMSIRLLLIAVAVVFIATLLVSFDHNNTKTPNSTTTNPPIIFETEPQESVVIPIPGGAVGPESFAFDRSGGGPYTGVSDGRILRWQTNESRFVDFAVTSPERRGCEGENLEREGICGRPLGLRFNKKTGHLYIADAYMGLIVVGPNGGLASPVSREAEGVAFGFTNSLDIDDHANGTGIVYFTDTSTKYSRRNHVSIVITGDNSGRLMQYDPRTNETTVLVNNLKFPNGVALSENRQFLLLAETTTCRLYKLWLKTGDLVLVAELPGFPDNIKRTSNGEFWVGINSRRGKLMEWIVSNPWIGHALVRYLPMVDITKLYTRLGNNVIVGSAMGIRLDRDGNNVVGVLESSERKRWKAVSEVEEGNNGELWIGSVSRGSVIREKIGREVKMMG